jgi:hypothetical protein
MPAKGGVSHTSTMTKRSLTDYNYYLGSAKQVSDYKTTTEFITNHIKKIFDYGNDIGTTPENLVHRDMLEWKPTMRVSNSIDEAT